ncbi:MAG: RNA polymerase factor sigma-54 [Candidatus Tectomicrobia bacterium]|uniref:RNA polymerase factor sigma-54 n=1 Tax=Tectimicrobiota bacterium TaxID=2528274 RepID=A0A932CNQ4_UNCTE|nr:RNA polymerase factor sigma-54 [Candidatus Tectomicrobia bacterium]
MTMKARLEIKQTQKLVMTTMLQQAIELLTMTRLELTQVIQQELLENPLLEELTDSEFEIEGEPTGMYEGSAEEGEEEPPRQEEGTEEFDIDWENYILDNLDLGFSEEEATRAPSPESVLPKEVTLSDHLIWQLNLSCQTEREKEIGLALIGNLDDDGYLRAGIEEVATECGETVEDVERVLAIVQSFEPTGVGARTLQECLLLQTHTLERERELAEELIHNHLASLEARDFARISRALGVPVEQVMEACKQIKALTPYPGRKFGQERIEYIMPDVLVVKNGEDYQVIINDEGVPKLRVNPYYRNILRGGGGLKSSARQFVEEKFRSAIWLIKGIEQRRQTLYKVSKSIVTFQKDFFDRGLDCLKPLVLRDVAEDIGMHESTVSRVTSHKYMHTPQGLLDFKYFFHSGISHRDGDDLSSKTVKNMIKQMIIQEDPQKPLTDDKIVKLLHKDNIIIARRTVNKYRKELKIPPSSKRKKLLL